MEIYGESLVTMGYSPYYPIFWLYPGLLLRHLKNVRFKFADRRHIIPRLWNVAEFKYNARIDIWMKSMAIEHGIIDTTTLFYGIDPLGPRQLHIPPFSYFDSFVIVSTVSSDSRRESSETLSFQGLASSVWALVGFSLLVVSGLATYFSFEKEKKNRRDSPFNSWVNSVFIYAADIVNNCVAGVVRPGPGRHLRSWWLLGVAFLIQFWGAGMKSDLLLGRSSFIDSLEDLLSKPELLCLIYRPGGDPFVVTEDDPRYQGIRKMKKRIVNSIEDENSFTILSSGRGVIMDTEQHVMNPSENLFQKLKESNRKKYIGNERYEGRYSYMLFNKRLPRVIKEDVDYLTSRLTETRQTEPRLRFEKFNSREYVFDATENSASTMSYSAQSVEFLSPVFRMWIIGVSFATFVFCFEFYRNPMSRRRPVKASPQTIRFWT